MRRKTVVTSVVVLLLALVPTYFIIFNSLNTTGLPDFGSQKYAEITEPNQHMLTLPASRDEYYLMAGVLSNLSASPVTDAAVNTDAQYRITFVSQNGNKTSCYIYAAADKLSAYVETAQGKLYELYMPSVTYKNELLSPALVQYWREKTDGTKVSTDEPFTRVDENGYDPFVYEIPTFESLQELVLAEDEMRMHATLRDANGEDITSFSSLSSLLSYENVANVRTVNLVVEWYLEKNVTLRTVYIFRIGE